MHNGFPPADLLNYKLMMREDIKVNEPKFAIFKDKLRNGTGKTSRINTRIRNLYVNQRAINEYNE